MACATYVALRLLDVDWCVALAIQMQSKCRARCERPHAGKKRYGRSSDVGIQVKLTFGTLPADAGLISFERGGRCRQYLFDQDVPFLDAFFGEITYPLKIILLVTPVGMAAMFLGIGVTRLFAVCGPLVAIGSHVVDAVALGGIAVYPVCSVAVVGRFLTLTDLATILIFSGYGNDFDNTFALSRALFSSTPHALCYNSALEPGYQASMSSAREPPADHLVDRVPVILIGC